MWKSNFRGKKTSTVIQRMLYISCYVSCQSIVQEAIRMSCVVICKTQQLHWFVTIKATSTSPQLLHLQDFLKTFTVRESARKWWVTFSLMAQLRCDQNDMLDYRLSMVLESKVTIYKLPCKLLANLSKALKSEIS